jgi:hypothetical protein
MPKDKSSGKKLADMMYGSDQMRATPQSRITGPVANALRKAQQFASQYELDPRIPLLGGTGVDELLSLPEAASLMEDVSYNGPGALIRGGNAATGGIGTFRPDPRTASAADVALTASGLGSLGAKAAKATPGALKAGARNLSTPRTMSPEAGAVRIKAPSAPQERAMRLAQQRAALPVEQGGLGLPANNTAEQRAIAMGFDRDTFHGSLRDINKLDPRLGSTESHAGRGVYSTDSPEDASLNYANIYGPDVIGRVERGLEERDKDFRKIYGRMRDEVLTPRQQEIILRNTAGADNLGVVYPLKVRADKSIHLDAPEANPVRIGPFESYDEVADAYVDTPHTAKFREALDEFGELGGEANPIYEVVQDGDGPVPARDVFNAVKKTGNESGLYDPYTGEIVSGGVAAGDFVKHFGIDEIRHTPEFRNQQLNIGNEHTISLNPDNVRSRFAAFDPFRKDVATAAAMGVLAPDLLAKEKDEGKKKDKETKKASGGRVHFSDNPDVMALELQAGGLVKKALKAAVKIPQKAVPLVEAPSIVIPSGISSVKEAARQSKGEYGARRIERAADEVKNLERLYNEKALREAFLGDNAKAVVTMNPADFERYAQILKGRTKADIGPKMAELAKQGDIDKYTVPMDEYIQHLMRVQGGFDQAPYLNLYKDEVGIPSMPEVRGHEGRHRSRALSEAGESKGLVQISPRGDLREGLPRGSQEEYIEALREELERSGRLVIPEVDGSYRRPAVELPEPYAEGGAVRMQAGGIAKLAKLARAPAKSKQEIQSIAERMAPQVTGEYVRESAKSAKTVAGKTQKQFQREKNLPVDVRATTEERIPKAVDIEKLKDEVMIGIPGDPTLAGKTLYGVGDVRLGSPSPQHGGPLYGLYNDPNFWASGEDAAKKVQNLARSVSELYDAPVLGNYIMMGPDSLSYAQHFADANLQAIDLSKMTKQQIEMFNEIIREGYNYKKKGERLQRVFPSFPGIEDKDSAYLHMAMDPDLRKHFNEVMQKPTVTEPLNLPSGQDIRFAITEPALRDMESGVTGYSIGRMRPDVSSEGLKLSQHPTYSHDIPGQFMGTSKYPMPYELTFPDTVKSIRENPRQAPYEFGTLQYGSTHQTIDQQMIDEIRAYEERMKQLTGKKAGGAVRKAAGGEITADDLILEERKL